MSAIGVHTLGAILYKETGTDKDKIEKCFDHVLSGLDLYDSGEMVEDEILYGSAGYLYCLLLLLKHFKEKEKVLKSAIFMVVSNLVRSGKAPGKQYLHFTFHGKPYLGAAHGTIGILYLIIKAALAVDAIKNDQATLASV